MDKGIRCNLRSQWEIDTRQVRGHQVDPYLFPNQFGRERKREKEETEREFRVRNSHFSLDFPAIGPAASRETRDKVDPHGKGYAWVPVLWSFDNCGR